MCYLITEGKGEIHCFSLEIFIKMLKTKTNKKNPAIIIRAFATLSDTAK